MFRLFKPIKKKLTEIHNKNYDEEKRKDFININKESLSSTIKEALWIDVQDPNSDELRFIESVSQYKSLSILDDVEEIEHSARYYVEGDKTYVHSLFIHHTDSKLKTATVAFIISPTQLLTFRDVELADFRLFRMRARRGLVEATTPIGVTLCIMEQKIEDLADAVEDIYLDLEKICTNLSELNTKELEEVIRTIIHQDDENGKIRMCLMDTKRTITYLQRHFHKERHFDQSREMLKDIETLTSHTQFIFDKINFLMDAGQGFINIQQNKIIKTLSIATLIFMPPTLIASMYGMNFSFMPELSWKSGYHFAQAMMIGSAIITLIYFKWKKLL